MSQDDCSGCLSLWTKLPCYIEAAANNPRWKPQEAGAAAQRPSTAEESEHMDSISFVTAFVL